MSCRRLRRIQWLVCHTYRRCPLARWNHRRSWGWRRFRLVRCSRLGRDVCPLYIRCGIQWHQREGPPLISFFVKGGPVGHASIHQTNVDVVEVILWIDPFTAAIVNLEAQIWRSNTGLNRREVSRCGDIRKRQASGMWTGHHLPIMSVCGK